MKKKRFTEEQIIRILQVAESGLSGTDVCRKHNCSEQSFYRWKAKFDAAACALTNLVMAQKRLLRLSSA